MRSVLLAFLLLQASLAAQDITSLLDYKNLLVKPAATVLTVTASSGDGSVCTASKSAGTSIYLVLVCSNSTGSLKTTVLKASGTVQSDLLWGLGDITCLFLANPTATAIPAVGSWTIVPAVGVGWQCATNIRTGGAVTGQTAVVAGAVSWP